MFIKLLLPLKLPEPFIYPPILCVAPLPVYNFVSKYLVAGPIKPLAYSSTISYHPVPPKYYVLLVSVLNLNAPSVASLSPPTTVPEKLIVPVPSVNVVTLSDPTVAVVPVNPLPIVIV